MPNAGPLYRDSAAAQPRLAAALTPKLDGNRLHSPVSVAVRTPQIFI